MAMINLGFKDDFEVGKTYVGSDNNCGWLHAKCVKRTEKSITFEIEGKTYRKKVSAIERSYGKEMVFVNEWLISAETQEEFDAKQKYFDSVEYPDKPSAPTFFMDNFDKVF